MQHWCAIAIGISDEHSTFVAYLVQRRDPAWDGTTVRIVSNDTEDIGVAIIRFERCYSMMFGPPNDEAFSGHPLASRGLGPYGAFEVMKSSWIRTLERMNSVQHCHDPEQFASLHHIVLSFHDSTFECVAKAIEVLPIFEGSMKEVASRIVKRLGD